jgi:predicted RNA binding protein YcfA (HicA-like mRNA interferase family)
MTKREKRLQKLRRNPINVSFEELRQALEDAGFVMDHATGSHHVFRLEVKEFVFRITIPFARPVKSIYVKQAVALIDEVNALLKADPSEHKNDEVDEQDE